MFIGVCFRFNRKPRRGLQFLQSEKLLGDSAVDVANFLLAEDRLDKTVVGDYLGDPDKFNKEVSMEIELKKMNSLVKQTETKRKTILLTLLCR